MVELVSELIYRIDMGGYCLDEGGIEQRFICFQNVEVHSL